MTTKEQERKALAQIKKIVEGLGENSYVGTAFEGCFEIAEENIENDFACSMLQRKEAAEFAEDKLRKNVAELAGQIASQKTALNATQDDLIKMTDRADDLLSRMQEYKQEADEAKQECTTIKSKLEAAENEIIHLKAKLYDLITK